MARRGRPRGGDSAETRKRILDAARSEFAARGFEGASVATIAAKSDLAPSAVYHYFGGKVALYEEVFTTSSAAVWDALRETASGHDTLLTSLESLLAFTISMNSELRSHSDFLARMPMDTGQHPQFEYMIELRTKWQDETFGALAELGLRTGELHGFTFAGATEMLRALLMGWFFETYFTHGTHEQSAESVLTLVRLLAERQSPQS